MVRLISLPNELLFDLTFFSWLWTKYHFGNGHWLEALFVLSIKVSAPFSIENPLNFVSIYIIIEIFSASKPLNPGHSAHWLAVSLLTNKIYPAVIWCCLMKSYFNQCLFCLFVEEKRWQVQAKNSAWFKKLYILLLIILRIPIWKKKNEKQFCITYVNEWWIPKTLKQNMIEWMVEEWGEEKKYRWSMLMLTWIYLYIVHN